MKQLFFILAASFHTAAAVAQQNVGIGTPTPKASAKLDVQSTTQGVTLPSMTSAQRRAIANPAKGLLVFDLDKGAFYFYNGSSWKPIASSNAQDVAPIFEPQPGNIITSDRYGSSLSMSNGWAVVGAPSKDSGGLTNNGAAYILKKDSAGRWNQVQVLSPADLSNGAGFGTAVSVDSNYMAISAPNQTEGVVTGAGRVYIYRYNGSNWVQEIFIINPAGSQETASFGYSVSISSGPAGVSLAAGSPLYNNGATSNTGAVALIRRNAVTGLWNAPFVFYGNQENMFLGHSVAIEGNNCIAGAPGFDTTFSTTLYSSTGAVNTYRHTGSGWITTGKLSLPVDTSNNFGYRVAMKDSVVAVSGYNNLTLNNSSEQIRIYRNNAAGIYTLRQTLSGTSALPPATNNCVGYSLAVNKNFVLFGMPYSTVFPLSSCTAEISGLAVVYKINEGSFKQYATYSLNAANTNLGYGRVVGLDGTDFGIFGPPDAFSNERGILFGSLEE